MQARHCAALILLALTTSVVADDRFDALLAKAPSSTNALCLIDVSALLASPQADAKNWSATMSMKASEGAFLVSPNIDL